MAKWVLVDEFHLTIRIPANQSNTSLLVRTLNSKRFQSQLRAAIRRVFKSHSALKRVTLTLSR